MLNWNEWPTRTTPPITTTVSTLRSHVSEQGSRAPHFPGGTKSRRSVSHLFPVYQKWLVVPSRPTGRPQRGFIFLQNFKEWGNQQLTDLGRTRSALPLTGKCAAYQQMAKIFFSLKWKACDGLNCTVHFAKMENNRMKMSLAMTEK